MNSKSISLTLANRIFDCNLIQDKETKMAELQEIVPEVLSSKNFYLIADKNTTNTEWESKEFGFFVSSKNELFIFIDEGDATLFAEKEQRMSSDGNPMLSCVSYQSLTQIIMDYQDRALIKRVKVFARRPLGIICHPNYFKEYQTQIIHNPQITKSHNSDSGIEYPSCEFKIVEDVKKVLDLPEVSKRRTIDPGLVYENLHAVIEKLIHTNHINMTEMEKTLELPQGMLRLFCQDRVGAKISKETAIKLLSYFGLREYLYQYKRYSMELAAELNANEHIDFYEIKPATFKTKKQFKLVDITRKNDQWNQVYVYDLTFESETSTKTLTVSTPLNYVIGKTYEIVGLDINDKPDKNSRIMHGVGDSNKEDEPRSKGQKKKKDAPLIPQNKAEHMSVTPEILEGQSYHRKPSQQASGQNGSNSRQRRSQDEIDHDTIIRFLKETYADNLPAAESKFQALQPHNDIIHALSCYITYHRPGRIKEFGYTPGQLMSNLNYEPYDAYLMMVKLRNDPKQTKQELVYRSTDPQYQKKPVQSAQD